MDEIRLELATRTGDKVDESRKRKVTILANPDHIRAILDDTDTSQEHDVYIERQDGFWLVLFHANGSDAVVGFEVRPESLRVEAYDRPGDWLLREIDIDPPELPAGYDR